MKIEKHGEVNHQDIPQNFVYPEIKETDFLFGSGQLVGEVLRPDSDWRDYLPKPEHQNRRGIESSACYVEASQHALATLQEEMYDIKDSDYSARFNALLSDGTPVGGNPIKAAESFRRDGLIPESMLPFSDEINSWEDFHSFKGQSESLCRLTGKEWRKQWEPKFDIVFTSNEHVEHKYAKLQEALKYSPVSVSVTAWYEKNGVYVKPKGMSDGHLVLAVHMDHLGRVTVFDTYEPFIKVLEPWFNFDFGMRWSINRVTAPPQNKPSIISIIINWLKSLFT